LVFSIIVGFRLTGDFDGDGSDDYAVWRGSGPPNASKFIISNSAIPASPTRELIQGEQNDFAAAGARVK